MTRPCFWVSEDLFLGNAEMYNVCRGQCIVVIVTIASCSWTLPWNIITFNLLMIARSSFNVASTFKAPDQCVDCLSSLCYTGRAPDAQMYLFMKIDNECRLVQCQHYHS